MFDSLINGPQTDACDDDVIENAPSNVVFTGFLSRASYAGLIKACRSVICLTVLDHTMQRGAYEAIYLGKPVVTSNFGILRENFNVGALHVDNDVDSIVDGIERMSRDSAEFESQAIELGVQKRRRWEGNLRILSELA